MSDYRRWYVPGGTYFFTVVTEHRRPLFVDSQAISILRQAWRIVRRKWLFETVAAVLLPDHFHAVIALPPGDDRFSLRLGKLKEFFTRKFLASGGADGRRSDSRIGRGEHALWQRRFWEHLCRDEDDLQEKVDYSHWNPVKHGLVKHVRDYKWSSFRRFVRLGEYPLEWGNAEDVTHISGLDWE
jgi:putative transposase